MANEEEFYRISADQIKVQSSNRKVIPLTLSFDLPMRGGLQKGGVVLIAGKNSCGKTTTALQFAANGQQLYGSKVFFVPIEGRLSGTIFEQVQNLKTDIDNFEVILPPPIFDPKDKKRIVGHKKLPSQKWWEIIGQTIVENYGCIIIVDSIANLVSEQELNDSLGFQGRGIGQKLEAQFTRLFGDLVNSNEVTLILLTQVQCDTSGRTPGMQPKVGNAIKHQCDTILHAKYVEKWKDTDTNRCFGHDIMYTIEKSPFGTDIGIQVPLRFSYGIDRPKDIVVNAINFGIIKKNSSWYKLPFAEKDGNIVRVDIDDEDAIKSQGEDNIRTWMIQHKDQMDLVEKEIKELILGKNDKTEKQSKKDKKLKKASNEEGPSGEDESNKETSEIKQL